MATHPYTLILVCYTCIRHQHVADVLARLVNGLDDVEGLYRDISGRSGLFGFDDTCSVLAG